MGLISFLFGKKKDDDELVKKQKQADESTSSAVPTEQDEPHDQDDQSIVDNLVAEEENESLRTSSQEDNESVFDGQEQETQNDELRSSDIDSIADQVEAAEKKEPACDSNKMDKEHKPQAPQATKAKTAKVAPTVASEGKAKVDLPVPSARHLDLTKDSPFRDGTLPPIPENEVDHELVPAPEPIPAPVEKAELDAKARSSADLPEETKEVEVNPQPKQKVEVTLKAEVKSEEKPQAEPVSQVEPAVKAKTEKVEDTEKDEAVVLPSEKQAAEPKIVSEPTPEPTIEVVPRESAVEKVAQSEIPKVQDEKAEKVEEASSASSSSLSDTSEGEKESEIANEKTFAPHGDEPLEDDAEKKFKSKLDEVRESESEEEIPDIGPAPAPVNMPVAVGTKTVSPIDSWSRVDDSLETATAKNQTHQINGVEHSADEVLDGGALASPTAQAESAEQRKHSENQHDEDSATIPTTTTALVPAVASPQENKTQEKQSFFSRLKRTRDTFTKSMAALIRGRTIDEDLYEELETDLLLADLGADTTYRLIDRLREESRLRDLSDAVALRTSLKKFLVEILEPCEQPLVITKKNPYVILMVGVNGAGKTTTIGKLAKKYQDQGLSVMLAAGDTFRAAAVEQLKEWGERIHVPVIAQGTGSDSASVLFDAVNAAKSRKVDVLICDTAGRLQNKEGLMGELKKIVRVMKKLDPEVPHEVLLVLDGTTGQNAVSQVKNFNVAVKVTGLILTKLDGTAKGGVVFSLADLFKIPIRYVGMGERAEDLREFKVEPFVDALINDKEIA